MIEARLVKLEYNFVRLMELVESAGYDYNDFEDKVSKLEQEINEATDEARHTDLFWKLKALIEDLNELKKENNFFDKDDVLDLMSPNIDDEDFDEESIPHDSVFGED